MSQQSRSTLVITDPTEIVQALVGLKDVAVLAYERHGPHVSLVIEQALGEVLCNRCGAGARVKDRPVVTYIDLPVYGAPMRLTCVMSRYAVTPLLFPARVSPVDA